MADDSEPRRTILDRANRLLKQSKTLRKLSDELLQESRDIRTSVKQFAKNHRRRKRRPSK
jgi:hypothetical protein